MESAVAATAANTGWWSKQSTMTKVLVIGVPLLIVGGVTAYFLLRKKNDGTDTTKSEGGASTASDKGGDKKSEGASTTSESTSETKDTTKASTTEVVKETKTSTPTSTNVTKTVTTSTTYHDMKTLPNGGKDCGQVHTNFDRDFDYVKCGGVWYTKSKPNPATASKKGAIPAWKSLAANKIATQRLDARYPKG